MVADFYRANGINLSERITQMLLEDMNIINGEDRQQLIEELEMKKQEAQLEAQRYEASLNRLKKEQEEAQRIKAEEERVFKLNKKYGAYAVRYMMGIHLKANPYLTKFTTTDESVRRRYGITFDRNTINADFQLFLEDLREMSDEELVDKYSIQKVKGKAELEDQIMSEMREEMGLE